MDDDIIKIYYLGGRRPERGEIDSFARGGSQRRRSSGESQAAGTCTGPLNTDARMNERICGWKERERRGRRSDRRMGGPPSTQVARCEVAGGAVGPAEQGEAGDGPRVPVPIRACKV